MLLAMIEEELAQERRGDYIANVLWSLTGAVFSAFGGEYPVKSWSALLEQTPEDKAETGADLREALISRWRGGE